MAFALLSAITLYLCFKQKYPYYHLTVAISAGIIILCIVFNQRVIWGAVRFSRLLAIPLILIAYDWWGTRRLPSWTLPATTAFLILLLMTQFAFAWYLVSVYFG